MDVLGNGESLYFGKDDKNKYIGNNKPLVPTLLCILKTKKLIV